VTSLNCCNLVLTDGYQFCPRCGRRSGRLADLPPQVISLLPAQPEWDLPLHNLGPGTLPFRVEVSTPHVEVIGTPSGEMSGGKERTVRLRLHPDAPAQVTAVVTVWARDAERSRWWIKDEEREVRAPLTITRRQAAHIHVPAQTLLFADAVPTQCLSLFNEGDEPAVVLVQAPPAFTVSQATSSPGERVLSLTIDGHGSVMVWITKAAIIGAERTLEVACGSQKFTVDLRPLLPPVRTLFKPDYVVGIDFGTRNTSLRLRKVAVSEEEPISIGEDRFPSALFINPAYPQNAVIGSDAVNAWNDPTQPEDVFLVEGIKTLVRLDLEPYTEKHGPEWTVATLLRLYLSELRRMLAQYLEKESIKDEGNILYVFTLPVLDAGVKYARQEERMRQAASLAGFPDDSDLVWMITEPRAAAQQIAHSLPTYAGMQGFPTGIGADTRLCVVDAGGGTTDVCLGTLKIDKDGRWKFEETKGGALTKPSGPAFEMFQGLLYPQTQEGLSRRVRPDDREIGGNMIDMEVGYRSVPNGSDLPHFVSGAWTALYPEFADIKLLPRRAENFLDGIRKLKEQLSNFEHHKIDLSEEDEGDLELAKYFGSTQVDALAGCDPIFDYPKDVAPVIEDQWKDPQVGAHLKEMLSEAGGCDVIVPVGGTTLIPTFLKEIRKWSGLELAEMPKKERMTAVANGAVWTYDARMERMLPMPLTLTIEVGGQSRKKTVLNAYQPLAAVSTLSQRYDMGEEKLRLTLVAEETAGDNGKPLEIVSTDLYASKDGQMRVQTSVSEGRVFRLSVSGADGMARILWEVSL